MKNAFKLATAHPLTPLLLGYVMTIDGPGNVVLRGYGLGICCLWLVIDVFLWLKDREWPQYRKNMIFSVVWLLCWTATLLTMRWLLKLKLEEFQTDVYENLKVVPTLPPGANSPAPTLWTVANDGKTDIATYQMRCVINRLQYDLVVIQGHPPGDDTFSKIAMDSTVPLSAGGGSNSASCLENYVQAPPLGCADVTIKISYTLSTDLRTEKLKQWRFATIENGGTYNWISKNPNDRETYCLSLHTVPRPASKPQRSSEVTDHQLASTPLAKIEFGFHPEINEEGFPKERTAKVVGGIVTVDVAFRVVNNVSPKNGSLAIRLCKGCFFASEPSGFEKPLNPTDREMRFSSLVPGSVTEPITLRIIPPVGTQFPIAGLYGCDNCAATVDPNTKQIIIVHTMY
jgi:hypothetical protein